MSNEKNILEEYRSRDDFTTCLVALNAQVDAIVMVDRAIEGMIEEVRNDTHGHIIAAAHDTLGRVAAVMDKSLTVLADCEVA